MNLIFCFILKLFVSKTKWQTRRYVLFLLNVALSVRSTWETSFGLNIQIELSRLFKLYRIPSNTAKYHSKSVRCFGLR